VRFGVTPAINAFATLMLLVTLSVLILTALVLRRARSTGPAEGGLGETLGLG
jgi:ABC-type spermidine/putrescine transport system permease subunit II